MHLSVEEARAAYRVGLARSDAARRRGGRHVYGGFPDASMDQRDVDGQSAVSEAEVAKATGRRWLSSGLVPDRPSEGDVEGGLTVRWTPRVRGGLVLHHEDEDHLIGVLVVGRAMNQVIKGWLPVLDWKLERYWRTDIRHPAFIVPASVLLPLEELPPLQRQEAA